jgi:hypothetical protein
MLDDFEDDMIRPAGVMPHGNCLVPVWIEGLTHGLDSLDAMAAE